MNESLEIKTAKTEGIKMCLQDVITMLKSGELTVEQMISQTELMLNITEQALEMTAMVVAAQGREAELG